MSIARIGSLLSITTALLLGGCASLDKASPLALKSQIEPVMRTAGAEASPDHLYQAGRSALASGDLMAARRFFSQTLLQDPGYVDAINGMAAILAVQGRYEDSLHLARQAAERAPGNEMFRRNVARVETMLARSKDDFTGASPASAQPAVSEKAAEAHSPVAVARGEDAVSESPLSVSLGAAEGAWSGSAEVVEVAPNVYSLRLLTRDLAAYSMPEAEAAAPVVAAPVDRSKPRRASAPMPVRNAGQVTTAAVNPQRDIEAHDKVVPVGGLATIAYTQGPAQQPARVMVTNGMGRTGWAAHHAERVRGLGMKPSRLTNYRHFGVERTLILYREGWRSEAERILARVETVEQAMLVADESLPTGIDLQLILGRDSQPGSREAART